MIKDLTAEQLKLESYMSDISERCYAAGWMQNLEFALWKAVLNGPTTYGQRMITQDDIDYLKHLSNTCNCWIIFDDISEETAIELAVWEEKYKQHIS